MTSKPAELKLRNLYITYKKGHLRSSNEQKHRGAFAQKLKKTYKTAHSPSGNELKSRVTVPPQWNTTYKKAHKMSDNEHRPRVGFSIPFKFDFYTLTYRPEMSINPGWVRSAFEIWRTKQIIHPMWMSGGDYVAWVLMQWEDDDLVQRGHYLLFLLLGSFRIYLACHDTFWDGNIANPEWSYLLLIGSNCALLNLPLLNENSLFRSAAPHESRESMRSLFSSYIRISFCHCNGCENCFIWNSPQFIELNYL